MNVERSTFEPEKTPEEAAERHRQSEAIAEKARADPRFAYLFDPAEEEASLARAEADIAAGRVHDHAVVARWLQTWGTPDRKPFHEWLAQSGG